MAKVRCFFAIKLGSEAHIEAVRLVDHLKRELKGSRAKWVPPDNLHLTVRFLGRVDERDLTALQRDVETALMGQRVFELSLSGLGAFPSPESPKVLWAGVDGDLSRLKEVQNKIEVAVRTFAEHVEDKDYHPHITLARFSDAPEGGLSQILDESVTPSPWLVDSVVLVESVLTPSGPEYRSVAELPLFA